MRRLFVLIAAFLLVIPALSAVLNDSARTVTIFYTSDEHGYLEPVRDKVKSYGGAADLMTLLRRHGYDPNGGKSILLSGGDMWAGPAISSWFKGVPVVQVFNAMGYEAAAVGNHEFDFGQKQLRSNKQIADFPFLSANLTDTLSGEPPDYVQPYIIKDVNGVKTAVIGLAGVFTPAIVLPSSVEGLEFLGYEETLRKVVPKARAEGAELVVVIAHACPDELRKLAPVAAELSIPLLAGGHCHSVENFEQAGVHVIGIGAHMRAFARIDFTFGALEDSVPDTKVEIVPVEYFLDGDPIAPDSTISSIVAGWAAKIDEELGDVIGYSRTGVEKDWPLFNLLVDSWRWAYPDADIAISNFGGYREKIPPGNIKKTDIVAVWPFDNELVLVELTGRQVMENLKCCGGAVSGIKYEKSRRNLKVTTKEGGPLDPDAVYRVLVNSYIYEGGEGYLFSKQNPGGRTLHINWRDPTIDWILSQRTSKAKPLEKLLDSSPRSPVD